MTRDSRDDFRRRRWSAAVRRLEQRFDAALPPSPKRAARMRPAEIGARDYLEVRARYVRGARRILAVENNDVNDDDGDELAGVVSDDHDDTPRLDSRTLERAGVEGYSSSPR